MSSEFGCSDIEKAESLLGDSGVSRYCESNDLPRSFPQHEQAGSNPRKPDRYYFWIADNP
jgi:hypothetical protein